eukprot:scaffold1212_cov79-Skeletonema_dohrnii-CCMP3373.AAC.2
MGHLGGEVFGHIDESFGGVAEAMADYYGGGLEGGVAGGDGYGAVSLSCIKPNDGLASTWTLTLTSMAYYCKTRCDMFSSNRGSSHQLSTYSVVVKCDAKLHRSQYLQCRQQNYIYVLFYRGVGHYNLILALHNLSLHRPGEGLLSSIPTIINDDERPGRSSPSHSCPQR